MSAALIQAAHQIESNSNQIPGGEDSRKRKEVPGNTLIAPSQTMGPKSSDEETSSFVPKAKKPASSRSRALRLEQNRKAARESRRRKKAMVEELQRSLMFFSKSNAVLKQQNEELTRTLLETHAELARRGMPLPALDPKLVDPKGVAAPTVAEHALKQAEGTAATDLSFSQDITVMQPGATMQAMANFQQAAHAAMEIAARSMQVQGVAVSPPNEADIGVSEV